MRPRLALVLTAACALHVALVIWAGPGFMSSDDEVYARLAHDMASGSFELIAEHRANRLGMIAPTAAAYAVLGVGRFTTILWPLLWSCSGIVLAGFVARRIAGDGAGCLAALLFAPLTTIVNGSAFLIPDGPIGVQMFAASACLWIARKEGTRRPAAWGAAAALLVTVGVLTKLIVLWLAPLFAVLFVRDMLARRNRAAWGAFAATGAACALVFFAAYHAATGDALYRLHAVDTKHNDTHWAYENAGASELARRLTYEPALMLARALPELSILLAVALLVIPRDGEQQRDVVFWTAHAVVVIGGFWVGTTSFSRLAPLPLLPRMLAPGALPFAVLAAIALRGDRAPVRRLLPAVVVLTAAAAVVVTGGRVLVAVPYVAAAAAVILAGRTQGRLRSAGVASLVVLPLAMCAYSIARGGAGESAAMRAERRLTAELAAHVPPGAVVLTDRRSARTFAFYSSYGEDALPPVRAWDDVGAPPGGAAAVLVYWHPARITWRGGRAAPPAWIEAAADGAETVVDTGDARLVRLP